MSARVCGQILLVAGLLGACWSAHGKTCYKLDAQRRTQVSHAEIVYPQCSSFCLGPILKQAGGRHIDPGTGILHEEDLESGFTQIACSEVAADVGCDPANHDTADPTGSQECGETGMLGRYCIGFEIASVTFPPDCMEEIGMESGQEVCAQGAGHAMRRIQVVILTQEAAVVRRVPILAGVDAEPVELQELVNVGNDLECIGHRQLLGTKFRKPSLHIDYKKAAGLQRDGW